jgi:hypothetical protein
VKGARISSGSGLVLAVVVGAVVLAGLVGCGRHVVVEPETVARANDRAWNVKSEPRPVVVIVADAGAPP